MDGVGDADDRDGAVAVHFELATEQLSGSQFDVIFRVVGNDGTQVLGSACNCPDGEETRCHGHGAPSSGEQRPRSSPFLGEEEPMRKKERTVQQRRWAG
jgi:hypothetical protein